MIIQEIHEQMEKIVSTAMGLLISTLFGVNIMNHVDSLSLSSRLMDFCLEMFAKALIAVVSGVATYLAIHNVKKIFKHKI